MHKNKICGIYTITCKSNSKIYIGYSINIFQRWNTHKRQLELGIHDNEHLQRAYNKYGKDSFLFEILEECDKDYLSSEEHYWCNILRTHDDNFGFNIEPTHPYKKRRISEETKKKMKENFWNKPNRNLEEHKIRTSLACKGRKAPWRQGKQSEELVEKRMNKIRKPVLQLDLDDRLIKEWDSIKQIENVLGFTADYISLCCRGKIDKFKNYKWKFKTAGITMENA